MIPDKYIYYVKVSYLLSPGQPTVLSESNSTLIILVGIVLPYLTALSFDTVFHPHFKWDIITGPNKFSITGAFGIQFLLEDLNYIIARPRDVYPTVWLCVSGWTMYEPLTYVVIIVRPSVDNVSLLLMVIYMNCKIYFSFFQSDLFDD